MPSMPLACQGIWCRYGVEEQVIVELSRRPVKYALPGNGGVHPVICESLLKQSAIRGLSYAGYD